MNPDFSAVWRIAAALPTALSKQFVIMGKRRRSNRQMLELDRHIRDDIGLRREEIMDHVPRPAHHWQE